MKVIVASHDVQLSSEVVSLLATTLSTSGHDYAIRTSMWGVPASPVEEIIWELGDRLGLAVIAHSPLLGGRSPIFQRDYRLVSNADSVLALFSTDREMEGGTGHVVKAALERGITIEAYTVDPGGELQYLGSDEGEPQIRSNEILERMWREVASDG